MKLNDAVTECLKEREGRRLSAREIADWIYQQYPDQYRKKLERSQHLQSERDLIQQLVAEIGANRPAIERTYPQVRTTEDRPRLYYWTGASEETEVSAIKGSNPTYKLAGIHPVEIHGREVHRVSPECESETSQPSETSDSVSKLFNDVRSRLIETGTRNRLVHVNRANSRGNVVNIVNEKSDEIFKLLFSGKTLKFKAIGRDKVGQDPDDIHLAPVDEEIGVDRYTDNLLEVRLGPDALQKKLLKVHREARTAEEESGVNLLFIALGFLTWFEDPTSNVAREAPLVLVPVELIRNAKTSAFDLKIRDDEFPTNLPLQQRLKGDFGIDLPELGSRDDWLPSNYFEEVRDVVSSRNRWLVNEDAIQLGFFSFSKLLMYRDLDSRSWPEDALTEHELTRRLLWEGFANDPPLFEDGTRLDEILSPENVFHVVDADASQATVIEEVRQGRNLVVQGPPGTGKSQTITNIIAAAVKDGKTVLFVAEKMAALSVVHHRLVKVGLRDVCLELHSRSANKKAVLAELAHTLNNGRAVPRQPGLPSDLKRVRDRLNELADELHRPIGTSGETGFTVLGTQSRFLGCGANPPTLDGSSLAELPRDQLLVILEDARTYATLAASEDQRNPFDGCRALSIQPVELSRSLGDLQRGSCEADTLAEAMEAITKPLKIELPITMSTLPGLCDLMDRLSDFPAGGATLAHAFLGAPDLDRLGNDLDAAKRWREAKEMRSATFVDHAFDVQVMSLRGPLIDGVSSFFARWGRAYRRSSSELAGLLRHPLPKSAEERLDLVDQLLDVDAKKREWTDDREFIAKYLGDDWRGEQSDFAKASRVFEWLKRLKASSLHFDSAKAIEIAADETSRNSLKATLDSKAETAGMALEVLCEYFDYHPEDAALQHRSELPLAIFAKRFSDMAARPDRYADWSKIARLRRRLAEVGAESITRRIDEGELDASSAPIEIDFARAEALWSRALEQSERLRDLAHEKRHELVAEFSSLEKARLKDSVIDILSGHLGQLPQGAMGEMRVIRGEIGKRKAHMALRRLFQTAGRAIQRIKPVLLMSPISVAQYLPPGTLDFDLLLIDEASQVRPEDALGAIARAKQIVVVGDKKQLPPTSFFDRLMSEEDEAQADVEADSKDLLEGAAQLGSQESVLTLCEARGLGSRMLAWHYRSRDPSLIQVSNREFYGDGLVLPPSPNQQDPAYGMHFHRAEGVYDRGGKRDNRIEGEAIVGEVAKHARKTPDLSLGIATFSFAQRNLITELLELARRSDSQLDAFLQEGKAEDVFVKNIENVQGDERDVILVSVGYGPAVPGGKLASMSFGPVNSEGGERRLNVLFTRARIRCEIFASFDPGDIDLSRTRGEGPRVLKRFLEFAKSGDLNERSPTGLDTESAFEQDVAEVILSMGFFVDPQVGSAGFRVDLGVRHPDRPGRYILAVECDGATYHHALWARERDRLRQEILEGLGWRFYRIWSTDWFYRRGQEIERLRRAINASNNTDTFVSPRGTNRESNAPSEPIVLRPVEVAEVEARVIPPYQRATPTTHWGEPHDAALSTLRAIAADVIRLEGPIHADEIARRIATCFGKEKAGGRIVARTKLALHGLQGEAEFQRDGDFWFTPTQRANPPVRDRSCEAGATLKASNISPLEAKAALRTAREDNAGGSDEELIRAAARFLGFKRVGSDLRAILGAGLKQEE